MKFVCVLLLICGLTSGQQGEGALESQSCATDICELSRKFDALAENLEAVEETVEESQKQILALQEKEKVKVIFSSAAGGGAFIGPFTKDITLVYEKVITNIGNAYNNITGVFTAPVAGIYYFTIFYHAGGRHDSRLLLNKNTERVIMAHDFKSSHDRADNGANAVFVQLQKGDRVYVVLPKEKQIWGSKYLTTFSGFLVSQM